MTFSIDQDTVCRILDALQDTFLRFQSTLLLLNIILFILAGFGLYTLAKRRGTGAPWAAWVPFAKLWLIGSLSDQYQYILRGRKRSRRILLTVFRILQYLLLPVMIGVWFSLLIFAYSGDISDAVLIAGLFSSLGIWLAIGLTAAVTEYLALYDIYRSCDPGSAAALLAVSILFPYAKALTLFFLRNKDSGMPLRQESLLT